MGWRLQELGQKIQKTSLAEVELDDEIRNLQAGDERRGSPNGCCFDPAVVLDHYGAMGATQAWHRLSFLQEELSRVFGAQQHQVPATPAGRRGRRLIKKRVKEKSGESSKWSVSAREPQ